MSYLTVQHIILKRIKIIHLLHVIYIDVIIAPISNHNLVEYIFVSSIFVGASMHNYFSGVVTDFEVKLREYLHEFALVYDKLTWTMT